MILLIHTPGILSPNDTIQLALSSSHISPSSRLIGESQLTGRNVTFYHISLALCVFVVKYKQHTHWLISTLSFDAHITTLKDANRGFLIFNEQWWKSKWRKQNMTIESFRTNDAKHIDVHSQWRNPKFLWSMTYVKNRRFSQIFPFFPVWLRGKGLQKQGWNILLPWKASFVVARSFSWDRDNR